MNDYASIWDKQTADCVRGVVSTPGRDTIERRTIRRRCSGVATATGGVERVRSRQRHIRRRVSHTHRLNKGRRSR